MNDWQDNQRTIEFVEKGDPFSKDLLLACSLGLNIGFLVALVFL